MSEAERNTLYCSFCGKTQHQVAKLIAGRNVFTCDECVYLFLDILKEEGVPDNRPTLTPEEEEAEAFKELQEFFGTPNKFATIRRMAAIARAAKRHTDID